MTYIPDLTERFPEGFGGVDMTDRYFPPSHYDPMLDYDRIERFNAIHDAYDYDDFPDEEEQPREFSVGGEYTQTGFYGGVTTYVVKEIDRENNRILLGEIWYDLDGTGTRPAKWHELKTDENGNEMALEWASKEYGDFYIYA